MFEKLKGLFGKGNGSASQEEVSAAKESEAASERNTQIAAEMAATAKADQEKASAGGCQHKNLAYAGTDIDENGVKCKVQVCLDCDETFMSPARYHP